MEEDGIAFQLFKFKGIQKIKYAEYREAPGNIPAAKSLLKNKYNIDIDEVKEQMDENRKRIMRGTIKIK